MVFGFDFDNTIVNYEEAIPRIASKMFNLPSDVKKTKLGIKSHLQTNLRENDWTEFQGMLYGPGIHYAKPYDGAVECIKQIKKKGMRTVIVSHRTKYPFLGPKYNLHKFALEWIELNLCVDQKRLFEIEDVFFLETKEKKISTIKEVMCEFFIDDLVSILKDTNFPNECKKILFDPYSHQDKDLSDFKAKVSSWNDVKYIL